MAYEGSPPPDNLKPKIVIGSAARNKNKNVDAGQGDQMKGMTLVTKKTLQDPVLNNLQIQSANNDQIETEFRDIYNYKREMFQ